MCNQGRGCGCCINGVECINDIGGDYRYICGCGCDGCVIVVAGVLIIIVALKMVDMVVVVTVVEIYVERR